MSSLVRAPAVARQALQNTVRAANLLRRLASSSTTPTASTAAATEALPSFSRALFFGRINSESVHPYPVAEALSEDAKSTLSMLVDPVTKFFAETNNAAKNDEDASVPAAVIKQLGEMGAFGMQVPEAYSGVGLNNTGYARMVEIVGAADLGVGIYLGAHQSIGFKGITLYGTEAQKAKYLPALATGSQIAAFVLTEPGAGSDAAGIKTRATLSADGKTYSLSGSKCWISNGNIADVMTVFAKTEIVDRVTGEKKDKISAFIVERAFGGVTSGGPEKKMGIKCSPTAEVFFDNTPVPAENVLLNPGDGFKVAMGILNNGRFGMGAALTGTMKQCIAGALSYAESRRQFGAPIKEYAIIKAKVAAMASRLYATESLAFLLAANMDRGMTDYQVEAAASKVFASESAWFCADECIQIHGGVGFMRALPYERIQRDLRIFRIFEGSNEILRQMVGLTGMQSLGKTLEPLSRAVKAPLAHLGVLAPFALTLAKSRLGMYERPAIAWAPPQLRPAADVIEESAGAFGDAVRGVVMAHGKRILQQQQLVEAAADIVIDLTAATAALARAAKAVAAGAPAAELEVGLANLFAEEARPRLKANVAALRGGRKQLHKLQAAVAEQLFAAGKYAPVHPVGF